MIQLNEIPIYIGTSGYKFKDWQNVIYPNTLNTNGYLSYYRNKLGLNFLELSFTFYKMPYFKTSKQIVEHVDDTFKFSIKLHKSILQGDLSDNNINEFKVGLSPFIQKNNISTLLADFSFDFKANVDNIQLLKRIKKKFEDFTLFVSVPHRSWFKERYINLFKEMRIGLVTHIVPEDGKNNIPYLPISTNDQSYFRLYSNSKFWLSSTNKEYAYNYNEDILKSLLCDIKKLSYISQNIYIVFCNVKSGFCVLNAIALKKMIEKNLQ